MGSGERHVFVSPLGSFAVVLSLDFQRNVHPGNVGVISFDILFLYQPYHRVPCPGKDSSVL